MSLPGNDPPGNADYARHLDAQQQSQYEAAQEAMMREQEASENADYAAPERSFSEDGWQTVRVTMAEFDEAQAQGKNVGVMLAERGFDTTVDEYNKTRLTAVLDGESVIFEGPKQRRNDGTRAGDST